MWPDNFRREMRKMQRRMNRLFSGVDEPFEDEWDDHYRKAMADFRELEDEYLIAVELPGVDKEDINIDFEGNLLKIKASKKVESEDEEEDFYQYSKSYTGFARAVSLPESADVEKARAVFKNGVLKIKIPKRAVEKKKERKIRID